MGVSVDDGGSDQFHADSLYLLDIRKVEKT